MSQFDEYPKVISVGGISVTVKNVGDEARWRALEASREVPPVAESILDAAPEPLPVQDAIVDTESAKDAPEHKRKAATHKGGKKK